MNHAMILTTNKVRLERRENESALVAVQCISQGEIILRLEGWQVNRPSRYSVQIDERLHLEGSGESVQNYMNHSCNPSCNIDWPALSFVALRPIGTGDEITFHYCTSEWDMKEKFQCLCKATNCLGDIGGAKHLSDEEIEAIRPYLSPFLRRKVLGLSQHRPRGDALLAPCVTAVGSLDAASGRDE